MTVNTEMNRHETTEDIILSHKMYGSSLTNIVLYTNSYKTHAIIYGKDKNTLFETILRASYLGNCS